MKFQRVLCRLTTYLIRQNHVRQNFRYLRKIVFFFSMYIYMLPKVDLISCGFNFADKHFFYSITQTNSKKRFLKIQFHMNLI